MKELSIEEKAKAYDKVREKIALRFGSNVADEIFSQFEISEDERIRKWIIGVLSTYEHDRDLRNTALAWIEKQGEQKSQGKSALEAMKEEKVDNANKVEPMFNVGDWVVRGDTIAQILDIQEQYYIGIDTNGNDFTSSRFLSDGKIHLWTIQDAKDGDVLVFNNNISGIIICKSPTNYDTRSYCRLVSDSFVGKEEGGWDSTLLYPATKEQRDTLFKAMADAGYTFDFKKKELENIEQKSVWSEEDEMIALSIEQVMNCASLLNIVPEKIDKIRTWLKSLKDRVQPKQEWSEEDEKIIIQIRDAVEDYFPTPVVDKIKSWLKSLRPQNTWKPTELQMSVLLDEVTAWTKGCPKQKVLESLYNDLKKLREE